MCNKLLRGLPIALCAAVLAFASLPSFAQSGDSKATTASGDASKDASKRVFDDIAEAARAITGPAGNPECVWLGKRVVTLLWRDDLDTAFRHLDLYDRFGCPGSHIQQAFRCVVRQGQVEPDQKSAEKVAETVRARVHGCWLNPSQTVQPAAAATTPPGSSLITR